MMEILWPAIGVVIGASVALGIFYYRRRPAARGADVEAILQSLGKDHTVFSDILVALKGGMYRVSHLVVSRYGVFLIDERDERGAVHGKPDQKEWLLTGIGTKETLYNPLWRAREAVNKLQAQMGSIPITSLIVFVHARLKNDFGNDVIPLRDLPGRIKQETRTVLDEAQVRRVMDRLSSGPLIIGA